MTTKVVTGLFNGKYKKFFEIEKTEKNFKNNSFNKYFDNNIFIKNDNINLPLGQKRLKKLTLKVKNIRFHFSSDKNIKKVYLGKSLKLSKNSFQLKSKNLKFLKIKNVKFIQSEKDFSDNFDILDKGQAESIEKEIKLLKEIIKEEDKLPEEIKKEVKELRRIMLKAKGKEEIRTNNRELLVKEPIVKIKSNEKEMQKTEEINKKINEIIKEIIKEEDKLPEEIKKK
ncbi:hypothetical protein [Marinitoga lauensis]|uniref:hypothetical protein n=1 Tax=Marinitoga lauensis TaxID=2201189 RepID=UPI001010B075|nr:hypothetical protein [Marinitoga lauensis]